MFGVIEVSKREFQKLIEIMERLRSPEGCPWDQEQTHQSIASNLIEEAYEALDAIKSKDEASLKEELGDLLLQIVFHSQIAKERGAFDIEDVIKGIVKKLIERHPHVFGDKYLKTSKEVIEQWEKIKRKEKDRNFMEGVPISMPALLFALNLQKKAARLGFDWEDEVGIFEKLEEEIEEVKKATERVPYEKLEEEIGDLIFSVVNLARHLGIDPEEALRKVSFKFKERVKLIIDMAEERGIDISTLSIEELDDLWEEAKRREREE